LFIFNFHLDIITIHLARSCMFYTNFENINRSVVAALIAADENSYSSVMALYAKVFDSGVATIEDIFYYI